MRPLLRPIGHLAFLLGLLALSLASKLLGDDSDLGFFTARLSRTVWRYPEVTRRGLQVAGVIWCLLILVAVSPFDPLTTRWDEVGLAALGALALWLRRRPFGASRAER